MNRRVKVFNAIKRGETVTADTIMERLGIGRAESGQVLNALWNGGMIERVRRGVYKLPPEPQPLLYRDRPGRLAIGYNVFIHPEAR